MIVATKLSEQPEQFKDGDAWHVGRRVLLDDGDAPDREIMQPIFPSVRREWVDIVAFKLDDDGGLIFVDPSILRPYPSEKIEEPKK